jgi:hypothetical protein
MQNSEEAEEKVISHLLESEKDFPDIVLTDIQEIPGEGRRGRILSVAYYVAEAELCIETAQRGYLFSPARFS